MGTSPRLDFLEFIRSILGGLLKTTSSESSGPNGRQIINPSVDVHHPANAKTQGRCSKYKKSTVKNVKNVVFACILCATWIAISDKIVSFFGIFVFVSYHLECFRNRKCLQRRQSSEIFLRNVSW